jgi:hypothetical protein
MWRLHALNHLGYGPFPNDNICKQYSSSLCNLLNCLVAQTPLIPTYEEVCLFVKFTDRHLTRGTHLRDWSPLRSWLIPCVWVLGDSNNFPTFYGSWRFITLFAGALNWTLSWASSIHAISPHHVSLRFILIFSFHLYLSCLTGFFHSGFPTKILFAFLFYPHACYTPCSCHPPYPGTKNAI